LGIDVWFLIEAALNSHKIKEIYMGRKDHTSFEGYKDDVGKLKKMAEQVAFTIIVQAIRYNKLEEYNKVIL
jgi:DNA polymerase II large subunit